MFHNTHLTRERHNAIIFQYPPPRTPRRMASNYSLSSASSPTNSALSSPSTSAPMSSLSVPSPTTSTPTTAKEAPQKSGYLADLMAEDLRKKPSSEKLYGRNASQERFGGSVHGIGKRFEAAESALKEKRSFNNLK
ncbi:hypothetical protein HYALB_00007213 [Hymenoscyphus albidus]|uniref:Uncharacterized protein n=1 Tax=Hymenoscyphus albidus TaxID=595503 RepID=A0A9N9LAM5_9HELO|nr:hypothetical protein HYALB_00007213 [Hymenoscyphus albidus]